MEASLLTVRPEQAAHDGGVLAPQLTPLSRSGLAEPSDHEHHGRPPVPAEDHRGRRAPAQLQPLPQHRRIEVQTPLLDLQGADPPVSGPVPQRLLGVRDGPPAPRRRSRTGSGARRRRSGTRCRGAAAGRPGRRPAGRCHRPGSPHRRARTAPSRPGPPTAPAAPGSTTSRSSGSSSATRASGSDPGPDHRPTSTVSPRSLTHSASTPAGISPVRQPRPELHPGRPATGQQRLDERPRWAQVLHPPAPTPAGPAGRVGERRDARRPSSDGRQLDRVADQHLGPVAEVGLGDRRRSRDRRPRRPPRARRPAGPVRRRRCRSPDRPPGVRRRRRSGPRGGRRPPLGWLVPVRPG